MYSEYPPCSGNNPSNFQPLGFYFGLVQPRIPLPLTLPLFPSSLLTPPPSHSCHWTPFSPSPSLPLHFSHYSLLTLPPLSLFTSHTTHYSPSPSFPLSSHTTHYSPFPLFPSSLLTLLNSAFIIRKHATCVRTGCVERYTAADDFTYRDTCLLH